MWCFFMHVRIRYHFTSIKPYKICIPCQVSLEVTSISTMRQFPVSGVYAPLFSGCCLSKRSTTRSRVILHEEMQCFGTSRSHESRDISFVHLGSYWSLFFVVFHQIAIAPEAVPFSILFKFQRFFSMAWIRSCFRFYCVIFARNGDIGCEVCSGPVGAREPVE